MRFVSAFAGYGNFCGAKLRKQDEVERYET